MATRGRPPKKRYEAQLVMGDPLTPLQIDDLHQKILALKFVRRLNTHQINWLVGTLAEYTASYQVVSSLNKKRKKCQRSQSGLGNKQKAHVSLLLHDCAHTWRGVNSSAHIKLWESRISESPSVQLARICIEIATGKPHAASLRRQIIGAGKWKVVAFGN